MPVVPVSKVRRSAIHHHSHQYQGSALPTLNTKFRSPPKVQRETSRAAADEQTGAKDEAQRHHQFPRLHHPWMKGWYGRDDRYMWWGRVRAREGAFYDKSRDVATAAATPLTPNGYTKDDEREDRQPHGTIYSH
jgi:hypothetical protein